MLYVTSLDGTQVEPLIQFNGFQMEQVVNGSLLISFTSLNLPNNPAHKILAEESIITLDGYNFRVKKFGKNRLSKTVTAISTFFDLNDTRQDSIFGGTHTFNEFATFVFGGTGWTFSSEVSGSRLIANFGEANIISLVNALCATYQCEYEIRANNHIHFSYKLGGDYDAQYRYKHNVNDLSENVDTTKLKTQIKGTGANGLTVTYTSPNHVQFGIRVAEPINDDRYTQSDSLLERLKSDLIDYPEAYFELDSVELTNKELGERVWLIYDPLNIEFQTRVLSQIKEFRSGKLVTAKVILGNTLPKSTIDILVSQKVEIDENKKEYRSRFEQTNDRITLEVDHLNKSIASVIIKADQIELSVNNRITNEVARIDIRASQIELSVNNRITNEIAKIDIRANQIELSVSNLDKNLSSKITQTATEIRSEVSDINKNLLSKITQTATEIRSEVSNLDKNLSSKITQTATSIRSEVTDIDKKLTSSITQTATSIRSEVSSQVTTINNNIQTVRNDVSSVTQTASQIQSTVTSQQTQISGLGSRVSTSESSITQVSNQITSKVSYTDYTGSTIISKINQDPYAVTIDAQKINLNGAVVANGSITGSTDININRDAYIGNTLYLRGSGRKAVQFGTSHVMELTSGDLDIHAMNNVSIGPFTRIHGTLDLSYTNVLGLNSGGNYAVAHTNGLGIAYNGSKRIYFRIHGSDVGYITLS